MSGRAGWGDAAAWPENAVAIVGVGCRLPGGISSLAGLWEALDAGRDLVGEVPQDRFDADRFVAPDRARPGKSYSAAGGFLQDVAGFDADFFGIAPREASRMDPQQRLLLECAVEALDDAGIDSTALAGSDTAVVIGVSSHDYGDLQQRRLRTSNAYTMTGMAACNTANRISYVLDLRGPSVAVDTACSSALTAVHQACEAVRSGRSAVALAGAVNVLLNPAGYAGFSHASMLSPSGRCQPFAQAADGFVRAEGAGVLVVKPLAAALAGADRVHAVIVASGVNTDGRTRGLALPSVTAQAALLEQVYAGAGIGPQEVAYVEAHGTGTHAGDPVECEALGLVLGRRRSGALPIGSVKSNVGHLEAAAGLAGLLKALLVLRERRIPATLHAEVLSERIDFADLGLEPVTTSRPLTVTGRGVVGVNSFGFGGANAHIVLAPAPAAGLDTEDHQAVGKLAVVVSARTRPALAAAAVRWADRLEQTTPDGFYDLAFTACRRRTGYAQRIAVLATDAKEAADALRGLAEGRPVVGGASAVAVVRGRVGFVFCGNGAAWVGMGAELLGCDAAFRDEVTAVAEVLRPHLGWSVLAEMAGPTDPGRWERTEVAQPMLFAVQAGLVAALAARGLRPAAVAGHSVGEIAAAYCAGMLDRAGACRVIAERSRAQAGTAGRGRMAAVGLSVSEAEQELAGYGGRLVIAGVNTGADVTLAGDAAALAAAGAALAARGVFFRDLGLDYAFHSPAMDRIREQLADALADVVTHRGRIPLVSTVTGAQVDGTALDAGHWWRNVREPVRFADAVQTLTAAVGCDVLVEIGPHPVLGAYLRRGAAGGDDPVVVVPTMTRTDAGSAALDTAQAQMLAAGADVDWAVPFPRRGRVADAPTYPWQRERHWNGSPQWWLEQAADDAYRAGVRHPLLGLRQAMAQPAWQQELEPAPLGWLADHRVDQAVVFPAAAYVDMALAAGREVFDASVEVIGLGIVRALALPFDDPAMQTCLSSTLASDGRFIVASRSGGQDEWVEHASGRVRRLLADPPAAVDLEAIRVRLPQQITAEQHYRMCARAGLPYGPAFQTLTGLRAGPAEVLAEYRATIDIGAGHVAHPSVLDGALQAGLPLVTTATPVPFLPVGVEAVRCWQPMPAAGLVHLRSRSITAAEAVWDLTVTNTTGAVALELRGCRLRRFTAGRDPGPVRMTERITAAPLPGVPAEPSPLPPPADVLARCAPDLAAVTSRWHAHPYPQARRRALELVAHFTAAAVRELLPGRHRHDPFTLEDLLAAGVAPRHARLLHTLLDMAVPHRVLSTAATGRWQLGLEPCAERLFRVAVAEDPAEAAALHAYGVGGRHLAAVLRGETDPLELLFTETDALAARCYDSTPTLRYHHELAQHLLRSLVAGWPRSRPLRVLEVGAGTGGATAALLPELPPGCTHYTYTDLSPVFFTQAQDRFAAFDFVDYRRLDLEGDLTEQGFTPASFDLVIASNVLHVTRDLAAGLHKVADLLADGGHLLAVETHNQQLLAPIFGLLDSFWRATDTDLRPHGPLLARDQWPALLTRCRFTATVQAGDTAEPARSDHSVILTARSPRRDPQQATGVHPPGTRRWLVAGTAAAGQDRGLLREVLRALTTHVGDGAVRAVPATPDVAQWVALLTDQPSPVDVVLLAVPENTENTEDTENTFAAARATEEAIRHLAVLRALATAGVQAGPDLDVTLWLVATGRGAPAPGAGAAAWGAARSLANEHPRLTVRRIALIQPDPASQAGNPALAQRLVQEMLARPADDEVHLTAQGRFVSRLRPLPPPRRPSTGPYTLALAETGLRYRLGWKPTTVPVPQAGEVVVAVEAAALNYRDIMIATGLVPPVARQRRPDLADLGLDCAGTVTAVGPGVTQLNPGDRVTGIAPGCFGSHALTRADRLIPIPEGMTLTEAATVPTAFLTVQHSLQHLAHLSAGETLLVHGAAGGVGLAALQYARQVGAHVIATAGTPAKRDLLHLLGVEHVLDSRTLHFADQVKAHTGGEGVDVVLNSLAGEALVRSLGLLKPHGRFLELGKRDFLADNPLPLAPFLHNLTFFGVDAGALFDQASPVADAHLAVIREALNTGGYRPLPHRTFPAARIREAFNYLQHSRHIGKVVVTFDDSVAVRRPATRAPLDPQAGYLITGGFSGLGAATARHLAARGARHLVLISRRGRNAPEAAALLTDLQRRGVQVTTHAADAADPHALRRILDGIDDSGRRLAGVVHAAMVLDDAPLTELTDDRIRAVLTPKMTAGHLLDQFTRRRDLDFFVVYSSVAALIGNLRQTAYAAANLALEALVRDRRRCGLPATAIQWGAIAGTGYVHRTGRTAEMATLGLGGLPTDQALAALDELLEHPDADVTAVGHIDWGQTRKFLHTLTAPRTAAFLPADTAAADQQLITVLSATSTEAALALVADVLVDLLAHVLHTTPDRIDRTRSLDQIGVDSLMTAELATLARRRFACEIPVVELFGITNLTALAQRILARLRRAAATTT